MVLVGLVSFSITSLPYPKELCALASCPSCHNESSGCPLGGRGAHPGSYAWGGPPWGFRGGCWDLPEGGLLGLSRPSFIKEASSASGGSARPVRIAKRRQWGHRQGLLFSPSFYKDEASAPDSCRWGLVEVHRLGGQREAFPKFVLLSRGRSAWG